MQNTHQVHGKVSLLMGWKATVGQRMKPMPLRRF